MSSSAQTATASLVAMWRYPVKSMMGEELNSVEVTGGGLLGDRAYALVDTETGMIVSAKNPKKWPEMFAYRSAFVDAPGGQGSLPPVKVTLPDGSTATSSRDDFNRVLSDALGRPVTLESTASQSPSLEEYWPDIEELDHRDTVTDEEILNNTFFDGAAVHLLTTATIDRLRELYPAGRFEIRRFRPNLVVRPGEGDTGFVENDWVGKTLAIGDEVKLKIDKPCPRCVMTTLSQGDLPADAGVLRTAAQNNDGNVGVYATVVAQGTVRRGDTVRIEP